MRDVLPRTPELPPVPGGSPTAGTQFGGSAAEYTLLGFAGDFLPTY